MTLAQRACEDVGVTFPAEVMEVLDQMVDTWPADACTRQWRKLLAYYGQWSAIPAEVKAVQRRGRELAGKYN